MSDEQPLTREEVQAWAPLGPNSLKGKRVMVLFDRLDALQAELNGYAQQAAALRRERDEARTEVECYRATRTFWPFSLREAIGKRDLDAVKAEAARAEAVVEGWLRDSHELAKARAFGDAECAARMQAQAELALTGAALQQARDAVQPAVDAAVVAAVAAIEAERDSAYAQRDACAAEAVTLREALAEVHHAYTLAAAIDRFFDHYRPIYDRIRAAAAAYEQPSTAAATLRERLAAARAKALGPLFGIQPHQHCESCAAFVRALAAQPTPSGVHPQPPGQAGHTSAVGASARGGPAGFAAAPEDAEDPHSPEFYRVGQTGVERALPVADAPDANLHPTGRASLDDFSAEELQQLQAELDELERTDPAVAAAAANYDATVARILAEPPAAKPEACATCHGCGEVQVGTGQPNGEGGEAWTLEPCDGCAGTGRAR